jgi:pyridoxal phosphate enzyme (YggS family)
MTESAISKNIVKLQERIRSASQNCGRDATAITLLAVSKTRPAAAIREAAGAGVDNIGENYVQEAIEKMDNLSDLQLCWHFIGPLQSNKTRVVAERFDWVHSVDRLKIARRLSEQRPASLPPLQICLQVNSSGEESKSGIELAGLDALADAVAGLPRLTLRGLMTIPAPGHDGSPFTLLRDALQRLQQRHPGMDTLSMGMSADLELAITTGATLVRVGTDIFGAR